MECKPRIFAVVFIILVFLVSVNGEAAVLNHVRKLFIAEANNSSGQKVSPITSSVNESNPNPMNAGKSIHKSDTNNADAGVVQSSTKENVNPNRTASTTPRFEDNINITSGITNSTKAALGSKGSCKGSLARCQEEGMLACLRASKESKKLSLLVQNQGKSNLKVKVILPNPTIVAPPLLELPAGETEKMDISPAITTVTLTSGTAQCTLRLNRDRFHPVSFYYSMQISPVFSIYVAGALVLVLGGVVTCCKIQKRKKEDDGIPYQEVEMGLASPEGWDNDWDSDDWDEGAAVVSPAAAAARGRASGNGLVSRSAAKEGWDD